MLRFNATILFYGKKWNPSIYLFCQFVAHVIYSQMLWCRGYIIVVRREHALQHFVSSRRTGFMGTLKWTRVLKELADFIWKFKCYVLACCVTTKFHINASNSMARVLRCSFVGQGMHIYPQKPGMNQELECFSLHISTTATQQKCYWQTRQNVTDFFSASWLLCTGAHRPSVNSTRYICGCCLPTFLHQMLILDWCLVRWGSKNKRHKDVFENDWIKSSISIDYSTLDSTLDVEHHWEDLCI